MEVEAVWVAVIAGGSGLLTAWVTKWSERRKTKAEASGELVAAAMVLVEPLKHRVSDLEIEVSALKKEREAEALLRQAKDAEITQLRRERNELRSKIGKLELRVQHLEQVLYDLGVDPERSIGRL